MKKSPFALIALINCLFGAEQPPPYQPAEISQELSIANKNLAEAQKMFNPWYTGPILAGSASMLSPGNINIQTYLFSQDNHAVYNTQRNSTKVPHVWEISPNVSIQAGLTPWMDIAASPIFTSNNRGSHWYTGFGDLPIQLGFKVTNEGRYMPKMKVAISETFPTGKYQHLHATKQGTDAIGGGSYVTGLSYRLSKIFFWWTAHPVASRVVLTYNIPATVHVQGLNSYGGGEGTNGKVRPGHSFNTDVGLELSLNERWVFATDIVYQTTNRTTFRGSTGIDPLTGLPHSIGAGSSDYLQIAPALEYNWNNSLGVIAGAWFTVYGRNTPNFINYVLSLTYSFSVK
jgi:hypothetical protein